MQNEYWHKQTPEHPLFPNMLWSQPENKNQAGKLGIIGGNVQGFAAAAEAYAAALDAGVGSVRVLLPDSLQKTVGKFFAVGEYAPSTPSGSFSQQSLVDFYEMAEWADAIIIAGDLARNSETAIVLEKFLGTYNGQLSLTKDAVDYFTSAPKSLLSRTSTLLVLSFAQLQKLAVSTRSPKAFTFEMDLLRLIDTIHEFATQHNLNIIVKHLDTIVIASDGQVSTTKMPSDIKKWRVSTAAQASVWWLQNPTKSFQALSTAIIQPYLKP
jgi:NAD(P)H-hydrate repair Nnr-like enzyme with NAD(P)H-hydrate dehydratase domain